MIGFLFRKTGILGICRIRTDSKMDGPVNKLLRNVNELPVERLFQIASAGLGGAAGGLSSLHVSCTVLLLPPLLLLLLCKERETRGFYSAVFTGKGFVVFLYEFL